MEDRKTTLADQLDGSVSIIGSTARGAFVSSHFILALGSGGAIMYLVLGAVGDNLPSWSALVIAWVGSMVWYRAIENPLRRFIVFAWAYRLATKEDRDALSDNLKRTGRASWQVTILLLVVTLSLSLMINVDVAEGVTSEQNSVAEISAAEGLTDSYNRDVELLREQLAQAKVEDAARVDQAKEDAARWLREAINSKGAKMAGLYRAGNDWSAKPAQLGRAIAKAKAKGERHVEQASAAASSPDLQKQLTSYVSTRSASRDTINAATMSIVTGRRADYLTTVSRRNWLLFAAVCFVLVVFVYTARLLVLACLTTGESLDDDPGEGVLKVARRKVGQINAFAGRKLDEIGKDKFLQTSPVLSAPSALSADLSATLSVPPATRQQTTSRQRPQVKTKQTTTSAPSLSVSVAAAVPGRVAKLTVVYDGKQYSAGQFADKLRKWYKRWKTASKQTIAESNRQKYQDAKAQVAEHFIFTERATTVTVERK